MQYSELVATLRALLQETLPGAPAHMVMRPYSPEPSARPAARFNSAVASLDGSRQGARHSAVLLLFYPVNEVSHFALIQRPTYDGVHSGQVALPGGKQEEGESLQITALRETHEEIGIASQQVKIIGELTQIYVAPSKFFITPFIGLYDRRPEFVIDNYEVEEVLEVEFSRLLAKDVIKETEVTVRAGSIGTAQVTAPYFDLNEKVVWGATAAILSELRQAVLALASRQ